MGKIAKPQRSKKHKKIKSIDPFYKGSRKDSRSEGLNQKPQHIEQEIPKKLKHLGFRIHDVKEGRVGKKSRNKFHKHSDGPKAYSQNEAADAKMAKTLSKVKPGDKIQNEAATAKKKKDKKHKKSKISEQVYSDYIDQLKPTRKFIEPFNFRKKADESFKEFNQRVEDQAHRALTKSKIDDHFDVSDVKKMKQEMQKLKKGMAEKKKERLKEKKLKKVDALKEKKLEKHQGFNALQDHVEFGEVVHAPPSLSVRPKKAAISDDVDRPGRRMPELHAAIAANMKESAALSQPKQVSNKDPVLKRRKGETVKRRDLSTLQQRLADSQRDGAIEAYRMMKKKIKK